MSSRTISVEHVTLTSEKPFADVVSKLEARLGQFRAKGRHAVQVLIGEGKLAEARAAIQASVGPSGFMLFGTSDHGALLQLAGRSAKAIQYIVGNPLFALGMTQHDIRAGLYAPLRVLIYENPQGKTWVEYDRPSSLFGQLLGNERVTAVAVMLDEKLRRLAEGAAG